MTKISADEYFLCVGYISDSYTPYIYLYFQQNLVNSSSAQ